MKRHRTEANVCYIFHQNLGITKLFLSVFWEYLQSWLKDPSLECSGTNSRCLRLFKLCLSFIILFCTAAARDGLSIRKANQLSSRVNSPIKERMFILCQCFVTTDNYVVAWMVQGSGFMLQSQLWRSFMYGLLICPVNRLVMTCLNDLWKFSSFSNRKPASSYGKSRELAKSYRKS